jgi:hypothetical protein
MSSTYADVMYRIVIFREALTYDVVILQERY